MYKMVAPFPNTSTFKLHASNPLVLQKKVKIIFCWIVYIISHFWKEKKNGIDESVQRKVGSNRN